MTFDEAFGLLVDHEGGYSNDSVDPGGETKYGISKRQYPGEDIAGMTLQRAAQIYRRDYWGPAGCDALPDEVRFDVFDMAVNSGVKTAIRTLQGAVGEDQDGILGPRTLQAVQSMPPARLKSRLSGARLLMLTTLPTWGVFGKGWTRRIATNLMRA